LFPDKTYAIDIIHKAIENDYQLSIALSSVSNDPKTEMPKITFLLSFHYQNLILSYD